MISPDDIRQTVSQEEQEKARTMEQKKSVYINDKGEVVLAGKVRQTTQGPVDEGGNKVYENAVRTWSANVAWYKTDPRRLVLEKQGMEPRIRKGYFTLKEHERGFLYWDGHVTSNSGRRYRIWAVYPNDYPQKPIRIYPVEPTLHENRDLRHFWRPSGEAPYLCLFDPVRGEATEYTTAVTTINWAAQWFFAYEYFTKTGNWPGPEH